MWNFLRQAHIPASSRCLLFTRSTIWAGLISVAIGGGFAQPASAAVVAATATIDWSSLTITPIDTGNGLPTVIWNDTTLSDTSSASINSCNFYYSCFSPTSETANSWTSGTAANEATSTSAGIIKQASASTSASQLKAEASANASSNNYFYNDSGSDSRRSGSFSVTGTGVILFKVNYSLSMNADAYPAYAVSEAGLSLSSNDPSGSGNFNNTVNRTIYYGDPSPFAQSGVLDVAFLFHDGATGTLSATARSYASLNGGGVNPIPVPAAVWLLGSALGSFATIRRVLKPAQI